VWSGSVHLGPEPDPDMWVRIRNAGCERMIVDRMGVRIRNSLRRWIMIQFRWDKFWIFATVFCYLGFKKKITLSKSFWRVTAVANLSLSRNCFITLHSVGQAPNTLFQLELVPCKIWNKFVILYVRWFSGLCNVCVVFFLKKAEDLPRTHCWWVVGPPTLPHACSTLSQRTGVGHRRST
jgi:hypothetical protein